MLCSYFSQLVHINQQLELITDRRWTSTSYALSAPYNTPNKTLLVSSLAVESPTATSASPVSQPNNHKAHPKSFALKIKLRSYYRKARSCLKTWLCWHL